jgi:hypothetical protein
MITTAKYLIDVTDYPEARGVLDECQSLAVSSDGGLIFMADIL